MQDFSQFITMIPPDITPLTGFNDKDDYTSEDDEDEITPRLPTLDESEESEDGRIDLLNDDELVSCSRLVNTPSPVQSRPQSGAWSTISWSSLYERGTDSSLSWADDEFEKETTNRVKSLLSDIDRRLYEPEDSSWSPYDPNNDLKCEISIWKNRFPHLRIVGKAAHIHHVPKKFMTNNCGSYNYNQEEGEDKTEELEEIIASHGTYIDQDSNEFHDILNEKFELSPVKYFENKLTKTVFQKVWNECISELQPVVEAFSDNILRHNRMTSQQTSERLQQPPMTLIHPSFSRRSHEMIDENPIYQSLLSVEGDEIEPPLSLPNLRPIPSSAPPVRDKQGGRPISSNSLHPINTNNKPLRSNSLRSERPRTSATATRKTTVSTLSIQMSSSTSARSLRSKSGSPPRQRSITNSSTLILPPISNGINNNMTTNNIKKTRAISSAQIVRKVSDHKLNRLSLQRRSFPDKTRSFSTITPTLHPSSSGTTGIDKGFSVYGTKLKKINIDDISGRTSRMSLHGPAHWDARTTTPALPDSKTHRL